MWETVHPASHEGNPVRRIFAYALAVLIAAFLWVLLISSSAAYAAEANWDSSKNSINYQSQSYSKQTASGTAPPSLASGTTYYRYVTDPDASGNGQSHILYFPGGNEATATSAKYISYEFLRGARYGNKLSEKDVSITPQAQAPSSGDAAWDGSNLVFDGKTYSGNGAASWVADGSIPNVPSGSKYYRSVDDPGLDGKGRGRIIFFAANEDPFKTTKAQYIEFTLERGGKWTNPTNQKTITVASTTAPVDPQTTEQATKCSVDGVGWIVCPVSNFLAKGMDLIFDMLKGFLTVSSITNDTQGSLYRAWSLMRNIANVAFVIGFIIIIYSQLTGMGISNYGIKKILPRIVLAAILVNISYWICAIAVDLSNIAGSSLQQLLISIRESLSGPNTKSMASWQSVSGFILAGGTGLAAGALGLSALVVTSGASIGAAVILLLPMLAGLLLAVIVALLVLAARQALIILLIIASPLAFVAYLLPNTEKWFEKWRSTFLTMLVFFPIFSLIFGGSQLAGFLIIQNASEINLVLLGMFVQIAPLVITPMLVKFSGNIIARIANMVNNPNKGFVDRTRKWAQGQSSLMAAKNMARRDPVRQRQVFRRFALGMDETNRTKEARKKLYDTQNDARWSNSRAFSDVDQGLRAAQDLKSVGETNSETRYNVSKVASAEMRNLDINVRDAKLRLENSKLDTDVQWENVTKQSTMEERLRSRVTNDRLSTIKADHDAAYEEFKAGNTGAYPASQAVSRMLNQSQHDTRQVALQGMRNANAKRVQQTNLANSLANAIDQNATTAERRYAENLLRLAGGIQGSEGAQRALAQALTDQHKARAETIANANAIIEHSNLSAEETLRIAQNISVKGITVTDDLLEAAAKRVAGGGVIPHIEQLLKSIDMTPAGNENIRLAVIDALKGNSNRPKFIGFGLMDQMTQGLGGPVDDAMIDGWIQSAIVDGKFSANELVSQDKDTLKRVAQAVGRMPRTPQVSAALVRLDAEIKAAKDNAQMWDRAGERKTAIDEIRDSI